MVRMLKGVKKLGQLILIWHSMRSAANGVHHHLLIQRQEPADLETLDQRLFDFFVLTSFIEANVPLRPAEGITILTGSKSFPLLIV